MHEGVPRWLLALTVGFQCQVLVGCCDPNAILTDRLPDAGVGQAYSAVLDSNCHGSGCSEWAVGGDLPLGLTFYRDGRISGTPTAPGRYTITVDLRACSGGGGSVVTATRSFALAVLGP